MAWARSPISCSPMRASTSTSCASPSWAKPAGRIVHGSLPTHALPQSGALTIGRGEGAGVRIDDRSISRRHLTLHLGPELAVEDAGSANGSLVAGERLRPGERRRITIGETIEIGA